MAPPSTPLTASTAPVQPLFNPQPPVAVPTMQSIVTPANDSHYVSNYPIYENDSRRVGLGFTRRGSEFDALNRGNYGYNSVPGIGLTTVGGNLDAFALRSRVLGLNGLNTTGLNTGVGSINPSLGGLNTGLGGINTGLNSLNTGLVNLNTGLNNIGTGQNNLNNLSTGLNNATSSSAGLNNLTEGINNLNGLSGNGKLSFPDNLRSGFNNAVNNINSELNNFTNNVNDA